MINYLKLKKTHYRCRNIDNYFQNKKTVKLKKNKTANKFSFLKHYKYDTMPFMTIILKYANYFLDLSSTWSQQL